MKKYYLFLTLIVLAFYLIITPIRMSAQSSYSNRLKDTTNFIDQNAKKGLNGTILVAKGNKILFQKGYGYKDLQKRLNNEVGTLFPIASVTKSFTAISILQLEQEGKLSVQQPLSKYISDFPEGNKITLHHLLTHTSGIKEITNVVNNSKFIAPEQAINVLKKQKLDFQPGSKFEYSNSNYLILAYIIQKVSGTPYHEYVRKQIFQKAGMKSSYFQTDPNVSYAKGYVQMKPPSSYIDSSLNFGLGDIVSSVGDLLKYDQAIDQHILLNKAETDKMQTGYVSSYPFRQMRYGYGWEVINGKSSFNKKALQHSGHLPGYNSVFFRFIDDDITIILLSNNENSINYYEFCRQIANKVFVDKL